MADDEDLFGDDLVEPEAEAPLEDLEDDLGDEPIAEENVQQDAKTNRSEAEERREAMRLLSEKRKRESSDGKAPKSSGKKSSKGDKGPDKKKRKKSKDAEGQVDRPRRQKKTDDDAEADKGGKKTHATRNAIDEVDEDDIVENEEDHEFIDDEGEEGEEVAEGGDDEPGIEHLLMGGRHEEAEEARPGEEGDDEADDDSDPFGHKRRKPKKESDQQMAVKIDEKIAKMEAAAEADQERHLARQPAIYKLKLLAEAEEFLAQKKYHELFISAGGLAVLKSWIEPYEDGSLPNARIRSAVLKACELLPIDLSREDIKAHLKKSQLGQRVMFLHNCPDETPANKRLACSLINQWTRPIFHDPEEEERKRRLKERHLAHSREMEIKASKAREEKAQALLKQQEASAAAAGGGSKASRAPRQGEAGFRWHASIPVASKLDYVNQPKLEEGLALSMAAAEAKGAGSKDTRFDKKMREVVRKSKTGTARAAKPSIEGRSITILAP